MSLEKQVRGVLGEASVQYKKLDQLVRQGMMSPAALPILHRGLDKMQAGQVLNPQEREAVNKVLQSMLYIVTGDDTVFQKARMHTQKTKYQTEEVDQLDEYGNYQVNVKGSGGTTVKARSDKEASQKAFKTMGIADRHRKNVPHSITKMKESEEYDNEGEMAKSQLTTLADAAQELMSMLSDDQNLPEWVQSKITKAVDYLDTARDYMKSEGDNGKAPVGEEVEILGEGDYAVVSTNGSMITNKSKVHGYVKTMPKGNSLNKLLDKHGADRVIHKDKLKSSNVSEDAELEEKMDMAKADMGDVIKDFRKSDAPQFKGKSDKKKREMAIAAKLDAERNEEVEEDDSIDEGAFKTMVTKDQENKRLGKTTMIANPKTQKVRKVTPTRAKMAVKKGFVYAEEWTDEELDSLFEMDYKEKFAAMLKKTGKSLESMSDEEKKKFFNSVDAAHNAKNEELEEGYDDSEEMRAKTQSKLARMSKMKAKQEKETDPGVKEDLVSENYGATQNAMAHAKKDGANYKDQSVAHKYNALHMKKAGYTHFKNTRMGGREYNKTGVGTKIEPHHHQGLKEDTFDEASAYADARRAMKADSKGLAPTKKAGGTKTYTGTKAGEERHGGHIVMQLRKAVSIGKPVKFKDGKEHKVSKADAHKFLSKYNSSKPADREKMHSGHDNHDTFQSHINK
jgi:hypothetical protein